MIPAFFGSLMAIIRLFAHGRLFRSFKRTEETKDDVLTLVAIARIGMAQVPVGLVQDWAAQKGERDKGKFKVAEKTGQKTVRTFGKALS